MSRHRIREAPKPTAADKTRAAFYQLTLDWIHLHNNLPKPRHTTPTRRTTTREYGHPAEWAADKAAQIAAILTDWHDLMAEHRGETRPANTITFGSELARTKFDFVIEARLSERQRVVAAWRYLEPRFEQLVELVELEALTEIHDLHHGIQRALGSSRPPPQRLIAVPCPREECRELSLMRFTKVGEDLIVCGSCDHTVPENLYPFVVRLALDRLIEAA